MDSYGIIADAVREFWSKTYPQNVIAFFYQKYEHDTEWERHGELIECNSSDDYENVIFNNDFCEGQTCVKGLEIVSLDEVMEYYDNRNILKNQ